MRDLRSGLPGLNVTQTQSYGPEARGGASRAEVILSETEIDFPKVMEADVLLAMTQEAADKFAARLRPGGTLIVDPMQVTVVPSVNGTVYEVEITRTAHDVTGRTITANTVALGVLNRYCHLVSDEALIAAVMDGVPHGTEAVNRMAVNAGMSI